MSGQAPASSAERFDEESRVAHRLVGTVLSWFGAASVVLGLVQAVAQPLDLGFLTGLDVVVIGTATAATGAWMRSRVTSS